MDGRFPTMRALAHRKLACAHGPSRSPEDCANRLAAPADYLTSEFKGSTGWYANAIEPDFGYPERRAGDRASASVQTALKAMEGAPAAIRPTRRG